jgi:hypothetical protein
MVFPRLLSVKHEHFVRSKLSMIHRSNAHDAGEDCCEAANAAHVSNFHQYMKLPTNAPQDQLGFHPLDPTTGSFPGKAHERQPANRVEDGALPLSQFD